MSFERRMLDSAQSHARDNRSELKKSTICGCFYCLATFQPIQVERWLNEGTGTAICPECQIDSVIGSASGLPVENAEFLQAMQSRWFS